MVKVSSRSSSAIWKPSLVAHRARSRSRAVSRPLAVMSTQKLSCFPRPGFQIAEEDLRLRGPGDFFGKRQHGLPQLKVADFAADMELLKEARRGSGNTRSRSSAA